MKSLTENFNWDSLKDFCWGTFLFTWIERFNFLSLNFKITLSLFFSRWHACISSGVTSCPVGEMALHTVSSRTLSPMSRSTGVTSRDSLRWYWALFTAFRSKWIIRWCRRVLQFFGINKSDLMPHVRQWKYQICHLNLLIDSWCQISEVAPQSIFLWSNSQFGFLWPPY